MVNAISLVAMPQLAMQRYTGQKVPTTLNPRKKTHRVATVGFCFSKPQVACDSVGLKVVAHTNHGGFAIVAQASCDG
jgi:hypothetical protein